MLRYTVLISSPRLPPAFFRYKREHPACYKCLLDYIRAQTWNGYKPKGPRFDLLPPKVPEHWGKDRNYVIVEPVVPRRWFISGRMLVFLIVHRHLKTYSHLFLSEGASEGVAFSWDIPNAFLCDYFWSEVKAVLAIMVSLANR